MFPEAEWREYYFQTQLFRVLPEYNIKSVRTEPIPKD